MSVTRGREAAFFFSNYRIRVLRFLYGTLLSAYDTIGSDFKPNVDKKKYKDSVMECFEKINSYFLKERLKNLTNRFNYKGIIMY